ncbi:mannose-6-phosphate isomerase, partial [Kipferlia bialata]|eukprot:g13203.t1
MTVTRTAQATKRPVVYRLTPSVMHYAWGKSQQTSLAARHSGLFPRETPDNAKPVSELWLGTHPNGPASVSPLFPSEHTDPAPLSSLHSTPFPFLSKILSIASPLSLQVHPAASLAQRLHATDPAHYPDA